MAIPQQLASPASRSRTREVGVPEANKRLGPRIRELRKQLSCTQEELAHRAHISVSFLSMVERGGRAPRLQTLATLADALSVSLADLFAGLNEPQVITPQVLRPLITFLESQQVDPNDVDRLLLIAKALFKAKK